MSGAPEGLSAESLVPQDSLPLRCWTSARWSISLPAEHRFPIEKYGLIRDTVIRRGILPADAVCEPERAELWALRLVHTQAYLDSIMNGTLSPAESRKLGFPWSQGLVERSLRTVQATLEAGRDALDRGAGITLAGGTHHAFSGHGEGFCVFNDVAVAIRVLQREGRIVRAMVIDLDVHQGNGTARIFAEDDDVFTLSMHGAGNYPFQKEVSTLDLELEDGCDDVTYLDVLTRHLEPAIEAAAPDIVFYLAGSDPCIHDRFGRLALTTEGLAERDRIVAQTCRTRNIPLVLTMSGGYARKVEDIAFIHSESVRIVSQIYSSKHLKVSK